MLKKLKLHKKKIEINKTAFVSGLPIKNLAIRH